MKSLERFIRWVMRDITYRCVYGAVVRADHGTSVDLEPDDDRMRGLGLSRVPKAAGLLGDTSDVKPGQRCLFGFENADPQRPRVVAWEFAAGQAVVILDGGRGGVARKGDVVEVYLGTTVSVEGFAFGAVSPPTPPEPLVPFAKFEGELTLLGPVRGKIIGGARRVTA
jgi:hypothetical protein